MSVSYSIYAGINSFPVLSAIILATNDPFRLQVFTSELGRRAWSVKGLLYHAKFFVFFFHTAVFKIGKQYVHICILKIYIFVVYFEIGKEENEDRVQIEDYCDGQARAMMALTEMGSEEERKRI